MLKSSSSRRILLGKNNVCDSILERGGDKCKKDPDKTEPGVCGCGVPDIDTDGDGILDCQDGCPLDGSKQSPGICGCGVSDTTDTDHDGKPDCIDNDNDDDGCIDKNDPVILSQCESFYANHDCQGCAREYYRAREDCGELCLYNDDMNYCIVYSFEDRYEYVASNDDYQFKKYSEKGIQRGPNNSQSVWEYIYECDLDGNCVEYDYLNDVLCDYVITTDGRGACLDCHDGQEYCAADFGSISPSSPFFWYSDAVSTLIDGCLMETKPLRKMRLQR